MTLDTSQLSLAGLPTGGCRAGAGGSSGQLQGTFSATPLVVDVPGVALAFPVGAMSLL